MKSAISIRGTFIVSHPRSGRAPLIKVPCIASSASRWPPVILVFAWALILSLSSCTPGPRHTGILEGQVTIGPLVPITREGEAPPTPGPEVYAERKIVVYEQDGVTEVARLQIDSHGNYRAELPAGFYVIDINHAGIDRAADLPKEIEITEGGTTVVNVDIDTGIR
jgi:hypothetical protein